MSKITDFFKCEEPTENNNCLICFTDGSCRNNGKLNAVASYAIVWPFHPDLDYSTRLEGKVQTNNRAEYQAVISALEQSVLLDPGYSKTLIIYTDSMLLINSVTQWMHNWKKNNWKKSDEKTVLNLDLLKKLDILTNTRKVSLRFVKAHTGNNNWESIYNHKVDQMAQNASGSGSGSLNHA
jgi:ribonuclease HI